MSEEDENGIDLICHIVATIVAASTAAAEQVTTSKKFKNQTI